jgi:hypothetical protein
MPDKPLWLERLPDAIRCLEERTDSWVDRSVIESILGVGRRRAQQLLAQVPRQRIGTSLVARRADVISRLQTMSAGENTHFEQRRQKRLWGQLEQARRDWCGQPPVLVELPRSQARRIEIQDFAALPEGVELTPGCITVRFRDPDEALRKLMALAMAVGRNRPAFDARVTLADPG